MGPAKWIGCAAGGVPGANKSEPELVDGVATESTAPFCNPIVFANAASCPRVASPRITIGANSGREELSGLLSGSVVAASTGFPSEFLPAPAVISLARCALTLVARSIEGVAAVIVPLNEESEGTSAGFCLAKASIPAVSVF